MTVETDIKTALNAHGGLSALVGTRIRPNLLPQNTAYPAITYRRISTNVENTLDKLHADNPRFQFDVIAETYAEVEAAVIQLIDAMVTATTFSALYMNQQYLNFDNGPGVHRTAVDFSVWQQ